MTNAHRKLVHEAASWGRAGGGGGMQVEISNTAHEHTAAQKNENIKEANCEV